MDTNSIQPAEKNELAVADDSLTLEKWFLNLTALGVWQVSLVGSCLVTGVLAFLVGTAFDSNSTLRCVIQTALTSWCVSVFVWTLLSRFQWPTGVRFILSFWSSILVGVLALQPMFVMSDAQGATSMLAILTNRSFLMTFLMPSVAIGLCSLVPFIYRESLNNKYALLSGSEITLLEKRDDME